jgi:hypothetical protein
MALNPDHYAIVIGIDGYSQLLRLRASARDAGKFALWLQSDDGGGLPPENIQQILSPPNLPLETPMEARPVAYQIDEALIRLGLLKGGRIGKRLYFYFAGHGFGPEFDDIGMLMANAADELLSYNIGLRPYRLFFQHSEAFDEVIYILDCCRDPMGGISTNGPGFNPKTQGMGTSVRDLVVMAAEYGEKAFQRTDKDTGERRGVLTEALLKGLKDPAAADGLGRFTASSLFKYVAEQVRQLGTDPKLQQTPRIANQKPEPEIIFSTIPESQLPRIDVWISASPGYNGELVLMDDKMQPIAREVAAGHTKDKPWKVTLLRNRWYAISHSQGGVNSPPKIITLDQADSKKPYEFTYE